MSEKRKYIRTSVSARVRLTHPSFGALSVKTRDMSNGGVFLLTGNQVELPLGTGVSIQAQDMLEDAPVVEARIVRIEPAGIALEFVGHDEGS